MTIRRGKLLIAAGCVLWLVACKEKKAPAGEPATDEPAAHHETVTDEPEEVTGSEEFCPTVFAATDVGAVLGIDGLVVAAMEPDVPPGVADCKLETRGDDGHPRWANLLVSCDGPKNSLADHEAVARKLGEGSFRELSIGTGGFYAQITAGRFVTRSVTFGHRVGSCVVTVTTTHIPDGDVERLAAHVEQRITDGNRPRR